MQKQMLSRLIMFAAIVSITVAAESQTQETTKKNSGASGVDAAQQIASRTGRPILAVAGKGT